MRQIDTPLILLLVLVDVILVGALATPNVPYGVRASAFGVIAMIQLYFAFGTTTGTPRSDYSIGTYYMCKLSIASDFLFITNAQRDLWPVGKPKYAERKSAWSRLRWAMGLAYNPRGLSWNFEARQATPKTPASSSRLGFVARQIGRAFVAFVAADAMNVFARRCQAFRVGGSYTEDGLIWQAVFTALWYWSACAGVIIGHAMCAIVAVALGINDPSVWPNMFGGMKYTYTLRKFWGRSWQQLLRRWLTSHAKLATQMLRLPGRSTLTTYVELYIVFFLSGFVHVVGSYAMLRDLPGALNTGYFFMLQAMVITLEDAIIHVGKLLGLRDGVVIRTIGYLWTWSWMVALTPIWLNTMVHAGLVDPGNKSAFSLVEGLATGEWFVGRKEPWHLPRIKSS